MERFVQLVIDGIAIGSIYGALALALVLIFRSTGIVNFAQGEMAMFSTFGAWALVQAGLPLGVALLGALAASFVGGMVIERVIIRPVEGQDPLSILIVTLGLFILVNAGAGWIWGFNNRGFPRALPDGGTDVLGVRVAYEHPRDAGEAGAAGEHPYGRRRDRDKALDTVCDLFHPVVRGDQELALGGRGDALLVAQDPVDQVVEQIACGANQRGRHDLVLDGLTVGRDAHNAVLPHPARIPPLDSAPDPGMDVNPSVRVLAGCMVWEPAECRYRSADQPQASRPSTRPKMVCRQVACANARGFSRSGGIPRVPRRGWKRSTK